MNILKRLGWYLGGFSVGLIILAVFLKKKNAEFCYGIDCRILKNIRSKNIVYSKSSNEFINSRKIDTLDINKLLRDGDVDISKSDTKLDSCKVYYIHGDYNDKSLSLIIENCNLTATIEKVDIE